MTTPQDQDPSDDGAPAELRESDDSVKYVEDEHGTSFLESRWWRWIGIGVGAIIAAALPLPLLLPLFSGGGDPPPSDQPLAGSARVPDFLLEAADGTTVRLSDETRRNDAVVLVFYRGYF